jgi:flagellar protein FlgJ
LALQGQGTAKSGSTQAKAVAQQFEAILTRQFLSKTVSSMMQSDKNPAGDVYGYFLTDVLAQKMSEGNGLGLGKVLEKEFSQPGQSTDTPQAPTPIQPAS